MRFPGPALAALATGLALAACAAVAPSYRDARVDISSMVALDVQRYQGRWYEIARFPVAFQAGCTATTADYGLNPDGSLSVLNTCSQGSPDGPVRRIAGTATPVGPGRFEVRFQGLPFSGPYWVLWVDADYRTAVIGVPSGRAGWILNRDPEIPEDRWEAALSVLDFNGYDISKIERTEH